MPSSPPGGSVYSGQGFSQDRDKGFLPPASSLPGPCVPLRLRQSVGHFPCFLFVGFAVPSEAVPPRRGLLFLFADAGGLGMSFLCN